MSNQVQGDLATHLIQELRKDATSHLDVAVTLIAAAFGELEAEEKVSVPERAKFAREIFDDMLKNWLALNQGKHGQA